MDRCKPKLKKRRSIPGSRREPGDCGLRKRASSRRQYMKRKAVGLCIYGGCATDAVAGHIYCHGHLRRLSKSNRKRWKERKDKGLCIYCGERPQFWGVRCLVCRQIFIKDKDGLPFGLRRALQLYRDAERKRQLEQRQLQARFAIRKLLASEHVKGAYARALRLY